MALRASILLCVGLHVVAQRVKVTLDFGWRTLEGVNPGQSQCNIITWVNNSQCIGLSSAPAAKDVESCAAAACNAGHSLFQFCANATCGSGQPGGCWIGNGTDCKPESGWVGATITPPSGVPPIANPSFNDSYLTVVDLPHDFEITGKYTRSADGGEAFLPQNFSFYRKHFSIPASWQGECVCVSRVIWLFVHAHSPLAGSYIELYVEGALSVSSWWLNGAPLVPLHTSGYTSIVVPLSDATGGLVYGSGDNVLVARVDGTETTGW